MSDPWDEVEAPSGYQNTSARIDATGAVEVDLSQSTKSGRNSFSKPLSVSPYTSTASSTASTSDDVGDKNDKFQLDNIKYIALGLLQDRKWRFALLAFILGFMALVAILAGTAATDRAESSKTFHSLFDTAAPTQLPTAMPTTAIPTVHPSESPSSMPSMWVQGISDPFQLRLYWESGYYWQETIWEEFYCMACTECLGYTVQDGTSANCTSPGDSTASCEEGHLLWLLNCKDKTNDFRFEVIKNQNSGDQVRVYNTTLCLSTVENRFLELRACDNSDLKQLWNPISNLKKFELRPYSQRLFSTQEAVCLSQSHHPKEEEVVGLHSCEQNLNETTNFWEEFHQ